MMATKLPKTMLAWQKHLPSKIPFRVEVPVPIPKDDEVLVKIHAAGVCHSDYAIREMEMMPPEFKSKAMKFTFGHEGCGEIALTGAKASRYKPGDLVALIFLPGCGDKSPNCPACSSDTPQLCQNLPRYGGGEDGFFATYVCVVERAAIKMPKGISAPVGAVATDACITPYHAVRRAQVQKTSTVLLIGLGGLGFNALQIIVHIGARVYITDQRQTVLDEALKFGVKVEDVVPVGTESIKKWLRERGVTVDIVIDFVAVPETFEAGIECVRPNGTIALVGLLSSELNFRTASVVRKQINICGCYYGSGLNLEACLDLISRGFLVPQVSTGSLGIFPQVLQDLHDGKIKGRFALIPEEMQ